MLPGPSETSSAALGICGSPLYGSSSGVAEACTDHGIVTVTRQ